MKSSSLAATQEGAQRSWASHAASTEWPLVSEARLVSEVLWGTGGLHCLKGPSAKIMRTLGFKGIVNLAVSTNRAGPFCGCPFTNKSPTIGDLYQGP